MIDGKVQKEMNQATNLIQWKNLTEEQKADFDFENYKYEIQRGVSFGTWMPCSPSDDLVYRLKIEPDKWYYFEHEPTGETGVTIGSKIGKPSVHEILRPARKDEIPKQETLEDKIKAKWPNKEVVMLEYYDDVLCFSSGKMNMCAHLEAQSMKGFSGYVYAFEEGLKINSQCIWPNTSMQPVAVLFEEGEK